MNERKYFIKKEWIFNLESMHDKLYCIIYDIDDGNITLPINICGNKIDSVDEIYDLIDEASELEWIAKSRKVTSKEYGRIKQMVEWRTMQRYIVCMANGMNEKDAGACFSEM